MNRQEIHEALVEPMICEQATGCRGAGDFRKWANEQGYPHLAVLDWTSSAGDWQFIVSEDQEIWYVMTQENNYPRGPGFTRTVHTNESYEGTEEFVLELLYNMG